MVVCPSSPLGTMPSASVAGDAMRRHVATRYSSAQSCVEWRRRRSMMKRLVPVLIGAGACLALANPAFAQQRLTVATYGGNWGEAQKACILDPFAKASG